MTLRQKVEQHNAKRRTRWGKFCKHMAAANLATKEANKLANAARAALGV